MNTVHLVTTWWLFQRKISSTCQNLKLQSDWQVCTCTFKGKPLWIHPFLIYLPQNGTYKKNKLWLITVYAGQMVFLFKWAVLGQKKAAKWTTCALLRIFLWNKHWMEMLTLVCKLAMAHCFHQSISVTDNKIISSSETRNMFTPTVLTKLCVRHAQSTAILSWCKIHASWIHLKFCQWHEAQFLSGSTDLKIHKKSDLYIQNTPLWRFIFLISELK